MTETGADQYGNFYWCIKTDLSKKTGEIYAYADKVRIDQSGCLILYADRGETELPTLAFAPGSWRAFYAASGFDGSAVAVEHWEGEVVN